MISESFKSGDKVVCIVPDLLKLLKKGKIYTVDCVFINDEKSSKWSSIRLIEEKTTDWDPHRFKKYVQPPRKPKLNPVEKLMRKLGYKANQTTKK
jgi:hypothetical protein